MNAMAKFLVPLTIFLSASLGDAFVNHARLNHLIRFQQPMRDSTNEPSCEPIREPTNNRMEIDKVKSNKREPIASHSSIKRDKSTPTFQLVVASVSNKREPIASHSSIKYLRTSQVPPFWAELVRASSNKTAHCTMNNLRQSRSFIVDVSIDSWQCRMEIDELNFQRVGNSFSTQLVGSCHDKKSEQVGNSASTQLVGSCHDEKSERAGCIASTQKDRH